MNVIITYYVFRATLQHLNTLAFINSMDVMNIDLFDGILELFARSHASSVPECKFCVCNFHYYLHSFVVIHLLPTKDLIDERLSHDIKVRDCILVTDKNEKRIKKTTKKKKDKQETMNSMDNTCAWYYR